MGARNRCWTIDGTDLRPCEEGELDGYRTWVALHNHSAFSTENIASLNWVVKLWYMRPFARMLQRAFGLAEGERLDYREVHYHPPLMPDVLLAVEEEQARRLGVPGLIFAVTDHDEIRGGLHLLERRPDAAAWLPLGVELSLAFEGHLFHLGVTGLPAPAAVEEHGRLLSACARGDLDEVFSRLRRLDCLVVLNHPLLPWHNDALPTAVAERLLARYGQAIDALEFNAMRGRHENRAVLLLAARAGKPVVGGGDSHLFVAGAAGSVTSAETFRDLVNEVRAGRTKTIVTGDYFLPLRWKLTLRVLNFIAHYREVGFFRGQPVSQILGRRWVALDPVGWVAAWVVEAARRLGRVS